MKYLAIGQMSGTSLDGCDWVEVEFNFGESLTYSIRSAATYPYSHEFCEKLRIARRMSAEEFSSIKAEYEFVLADQYKHFSANRSKPDIIALHGHTIFHQPEHGFTTQIGIGTEIVRQYQTEVISDFRSADIALGGQGAPLVPIGDRLLFGAYDACINLGGYANISFEKNGARIAYDIGPCNFPLNYLSQKIGVPYDANGEIAARGSVIDSLYQAIRGLDYYQQEPPKSIGNEWFDRSMRSLLDNKNLIEDNIATATTAIADSIRDEIHKNHLKTVLLTGGGTLNSFLVDRIAQDVDNLIIPDKILIEYKEALIFALMGVLRKRGENNVLCSATGASRDHSSGIHLLP
jgi:anhydro-N-acetylmuramic acid kinase